MIFLQEYTMLDELGKGGFATVYKVRHNDLGYIRAIRVLNETIVDAASDTYQKFLRECKVLLRLGNGNHPNIVHIYQPRLLVNKALVEMDYVDGVDIQHYLEQNRNFVSAEEVMQMATQISSALAYCHEDIYRFCMDRDADKLQDDPNDGSKVLIDEKKRQQLISKYKVIHNDIHSGNIMRREDGNFVLLDFGLAINGDEVVRSSRRANGAPEYKAPEKWDNEAILSEQSDIYSFGVVLYQYLAGRVPFPYDKSEKSNYRAEFKLAEAHKNATPPSIEALRRERYEKKFEGKTYERDYPKWLEDVILKCLRKNPAERFKNGRELHDYIITESQKHNGIYNDVEIDRLTTANKELTAQVNDSRATNYELGSQLNSAQEQLNQTKETLQKAEKRIKDLEKNKKPKWWKWLLGLFLLCLVGLCGIGYHDSEMSDLRARIYELGTEKDTLQAQNDSLKSVIENMPSRGDKNSKSGSSKEVADLKSRISSLQSEIDRLNAQIKQKNSRISELEKGSKQNDNSAQVAELKRQITAKDSEIRSLKEQIANLKKQSASMDNSKEINELKQRVKAKDVEISNLRQQLAAKGNSSSSDVTELKSQLKKKETEMILLQRQLSKAQTDLAEANRKIAEKERLIKVLEGQLDACSKSKKN